MLVHIDIESQTRTLVSATHAALASVSMPEVAGLTDALLRVAGALDGIIVSSLKMFNASDPDLYEKLVRPWIFGWRNDVELPEGVTFEGVVLDAAAPPSPWAADTAAPVRTFLRGETGAQSSIVPSMDALLGITHKVGGGRGNVGMPPSSEPFFPVYPTSSPPSPPPPPSMMRCA